MRPFLVLTNAPYGTVTALTIAMTVVAAVAVLLLPLCVPVVVAIGVARLLHFVKLPRKRAPAAWASRVRDRFVMAHDGVMLHTQTIGSPKASRAVLFAHGLGGKLYAWDSVINAIMSRPDADDWVLIFWDYRGQFDSESPKRSGRLSIRDHAEDVADILKDLGIQRLHAMIGWSTGVQVTLEFASIYPESVDRLGLLNGADGHILANAFQPILHIPFLADLLHIAIWFVRRNLDLLWPLIVRGMNVARLFVRTMWTPYGLIFGNPGLPDFVERYSGDIIDSKVHFGNYLRFMQDLDAHSVSGFVPEIQHPVFLMSGLLDVVTPMRQSFKLSTQLVNSTHICFPFGTHFVLLEFPNTSTAEVLKFLNDDSGMRWKRVNSRHFHKHDHEDEDEDKVKAQ